MLALVIDTSTDTSTALLADGDRIIASRSSTGKALRQLHFSIQEVLDESSARVSDLERIGVVQGPGSWTGLNVALSTAKTLAQVYNLPLIPISFLDALAYSC